MHLTMLSAKLLFEGPQTCQVVSYFAYSCSIVGTLTYSPCTFEYYSRFCITVRSYCKIHVFETKDKVFSNPLNNTNQEKLSFSLGSALFLIWPLVEA